MEKNNCDFDIMLIIFCKPIVTVNILIVLIPVVDDDYYYYDLSCLQDDISPQIALFCTGLVD